MSSKRTLMVVLLALCGLPASNANGAPITVDFGVFAEPSYWDPDPLRKPFDGVSVSDFDVEPLTGVWDVLVKWTPTQAPFIEFFGHGYLEPPVSASVEVTAGGLPFSFLAVDLYSSVTKIPWTFEGFRGSTSVFALSGEHGNTFGNFVTIPNSLGDVVIDRLAITLTQPGLNTTCRHCTNPMGIDNIVVARVPEPSALLLLGTSAIVVTRRRASRTARYGTRLES